MHASGLEEIQKVIKLKSRLAALPQHDENSRV
jgi:hypothetical protein